MIEFWFWSQNTKNANRTFHKGEWGKTRHKIGSSLNGGSLVTKLTMLKEEEGLSITLQHGYIHKPHFILSFSDVRLLQTTAEGLLHIDDTLSNIQRGLWMVINIPLTWLITAIVYCLHLVNNSHLPSHKVYQESSTCWPTDLSWVSPLFTGDALMYSAATPLFPMIYPNSTSFYFNVLGVQDTH